MNLIKVLPDSNNIQQNVLNPAAYAAKHSELGFIISTGVVFTKIFPALGFNLIKKWEPNNGIPGWPKHPKTGKDKQVHFKYYKKDDIKVLAVWLWGSNKTPSKAFLTIEKDIIDYIRHH
ncbi:MAG: hypothetical protein ACTTKO_10805 [Candidatus Limimorpha sp.]